MANILDLMTEEDRQKSVSAFERRMSGDTSYRKDHKISPISFLVAEFGYYYGWGAVEAVKRGYIIGRHDDLAVTAVELALRDDDRPFDRNAALDDERLIAAVVHLCRHSLDISAHDSLFRLFRYSFRHVQTRQR